MKNYSDLRSLFASRPDKWGAFSELLQRAGIAWTQFERRPMRMRRLRSRFTPQRGVWTRGRRAVEEERRG